MNMVLETDRLMLRPVQLEDAAEIQRMASHPLVAASTTIPHPYPVDGALEFIEITIQQLKAGQSYTFGSHLKESGYLVGLTGLGVDSDNQRAELGYWVGVDYWNHGYATEAASKVLEFAFVQLNLNRVHAAYYTFNPASDRVQRKIGMQPEGIFRQHLLKNSKFIDVAYNAILAEEWHALHPTCASV